MASTEYDYDLETPPTKNNVGTLVAVLLGLALLIGGFLGWRHISQLDMRMQALDRHIETLGVEVADANLRAEQAEAVASEAERQAGSAAERAEQAAAKEQLSAEQARLAEEARVVAELTRAEAEARREEAQGVAEASLAARKAEEDRRAQAEIERDQAKVELVRKDDEIRATRAEKQAVEAELAKTRAKMNRELDRLQGAMAKIADTKRTALGLVMTLDSRQIEFDFNRTELRPKNREVLSKIAGVLLTFDNYGLQVFGHTDDVGSDDYNAQLSRQRAETVRTYLVDAGVDPEVVTIMGLGKTSPLIEGTDPESRQRNRRVELAIVFSEGEYEALEADPGAQLETTSPQPG